MQVQRERSSCCKLLRQLATCISPTKEVLGLLNLDSRLIGSITQVTKMPIFAQSLPFYHQCLETAQASAKPPVPGKCKELARDIGVP